MDTIELRAAFHEDADLAGPPPSDPFETLVARRQKSDRQRRAALTAGLAVVLVAIVVPVGISLVGPRDSQVATTPTIPAADVFAEPTRGSLAGDTAFVAGVRELDWTEPGLAGGPPVPDAPVDTRSVVFAGDVQSGRWALVVGDNTAIPTGAAADPELQTDEGALSEVAAVWYVGPAGATPEEMQLATIPRGVRIDLPLSLYDGATGALVVVAARGDFIEVSARPDVAADGSVTRAYDDTETIDGTAVLALEPNAYASTGMPAVQYRVTRENVVIAEQVAETSAVAVSPEFEPPPLEYLRSHGMGFGSSGDLAGFMAAQVLSEYGLTPSEVDLTVHFVGSVPGAGGETAELTVLTVTFPSGAVLIRADALAPISGPSEPEVGGFAIDGCVDKILAAEVAFAEQSLAIRCDVTSGDADPDTESTLVVLAPVGSAAAYAETAGAGATVRIEFDTNGVGMVAFPSGAETVIIHAADGATLDEVPILAP